MPASQLTRQVSLSQQLRLRKFKTSTSLRVELIRCQLSTLSTPQATDHEAAPLKTDSVQPTLALDREAAKVCAQVLVLTALPNTSEVGMVEIALVAKTGLKDTLRLSNNIRKAILPIMVHSHPSQTSMEVSMVEPCNRHSITDSPLQLISSSLTMTLTGPSTSKVSIKTLSMEVALTLGSKK